MGRVSMGRVAESSAVVLVTDNKPNGLGEPVNDLDSGADRERLTQ